MYRKPAVFVACLGFALVGCPADKSSAPSAAGSKPAAVKVARPAPPPAAKAPGGGEMLQIAMADSSIGFVGKNVASEQEGGFSRFSGTVILNGDAATSGMVAVEIDMQSLFTQSDGLTNHLKAADFFDVDKHPSAKFVSSKIVAGGEGSATHTMSGLLTLKGKTKPVNFPATIALSATGVKASAVFSIDRQRFDVSYKGAPDNLISDDVTIRLELSANR